MHEQEIEEYAKRLDLLRPLWPVVRVLLWSVLLMMILKWVMP